MANTHAEKGRHLERAVRLIQQALLEADPKLKGVSFSIEPNKTVTVSGVRHEIDVLVRTLSGSPYESTSIFECKDWREPVGKNEVIILSEKVNAMQATRGFLVARSISKDAEAQMKLDKRSTFIRCTDEFLAPFKSIELIHVCHDLLPIRISVKERGVPAKQNPEVLNWTNSRCCLSGRPVDFLSLVKQRVDELISEDKKENSSKYRNEATHPGGSAVQITFAPGEFMLDGMDVERMTIQIQFFVTVRKPKLISKFELSHQGRAFSFERIETTPPGHAIEIDVVQLI